MSQAPADTAKSKPSAFEQSLGSNRGVDPGRARDSKGTIEGHAVSAEDLIPKDLADASGDETKKVAAIEDSAITREEADEIEKDDLQDDAPPLPNEDVPPLPQETPPAKDDGWAPLWEETAQAFYFYNRFTGATQWTNPRVPESSQVMETAAGVAPVPAGSAAAAALEDPIAQPRPVGGYDPSVHGDYDPTAWYAQPGVYDPGDPTAFPSNTTEAYAATGAFNRFTGRWQAADLTPENHNDENKSKRQMNAFFDVDAAANSHDGRSLKAERSGKKLSKTELKQFKEKRKAKKEEKRRAWLRD